MAVVRLDNIKAETFRWAFVRAGYNEAEAVAAFPMLESWLSGEQLPTLRQLEKFAAKFFVPMGFLFLQQKPSRQYHQDTMKEPLSRFQWLQMNSYSIHAEAQTLA